jgi:hypothetical protein
MKDQPAGGAFQVQRSAIVTALAAIRHEGVSLLLALPKDF